MNRNTMLTERVCDRDVLGRRGVLLTAIPAGRVIGDELRYDSGGRMLDKVEAGSRLLKRDAETGRIVVTCGGQKRDRCFRVREELSGERPVFDGVPVANRWCWCG